jgi:hypothetical protein
MPLRPRIYVQRGKRRNPLFYKVFYFLNKTFKNNGLHAP